VILHRLQRLRGKLVFAGLVAGLWFGLNAEPRRTGMAADEAAVYALALGTASAHAPGWEPYRLVQSAPAVATYLTLSEGPRDYGWLRKDFPRLLPSTVAEFTRRQSEGGALNRILPRRRVLLVLPGDEDEDEARLGAAPRYALSRIGFDPDRTQAMVYVSYVCGTTCGQGLYVFLERAAGGRWRVRGSIMAWIS
jgi:hypothetical protein